MCNCVAEINEKLEPEHMLNVAWSFNNAPEKPLIGLVRKDVWKLENRRGKRAHFVPSFCPFCGEKYPEPEVVVREAAS